MSGQLAMAQPRVAATRLPLHGTLEWPWLVIAVRTEMASLFVVIHWAHAKMETNELM
jgi:hypothetical protein